MLKNFRGVPSLGHRRTATHDPNRQRKREQRKARARLAKIASSSARLLEDRSPKQLSLPWQDTGRSPVVSHDSESLQTGSRQGGDSQDWGFSPHDASYVRDQYARSGRRLADDQQAPRARQFHNDHDLSAYSPSELRAIPQSVGLDANASVSQVDRSDAAQLNRRVEQESVGRESTTSSASQESSTTNLGSQTQASTPASPRVIDILRKYTPAAMQLNRVPQPVVDRDSMEMVGLIVSILIRKERIIS